MESTLVIKVKCGEILRRFNTLIDKNEKLELNMEQMREKMRRLFNLAADDDFTLTYTDTDGDIVTLVEDCDLDDVVLQRLNPVRMNLTLKSGDKSSSSNMMSSRNFTPMYSPRIQESIGNIQTNVEKVVKSVPQPLRGVLLKLTRDLAATASAPVIADLIHSSTKIGESFTYENSQSFAQKEPNVENKGDEGETSSGLPRSKSKIDAAVRVKAKAIDPGVCRVPDLNHAPPPPFGFASTKAVSNAFHDNNEKGDIRCPMFPFGDTSNVNVKQYNGCPFMRTGDAKFHPAYKGNRSSPFKRSPTYFDSVGPVFHTGVRCDECGVHPIIGPRFKSKVRHNYDLCSLCYQKSGIETDYVKIDSPMLYHPIMKAVHRRRGGHENRFEANELFKQVAYPFLPFTSKPASLVNQVKLDSRFILDVTVMDGTVMAPLTRFTKIWRMQNNGNVVWPVGTKLIWTHGGEIFSNGLSVNLEIPAGGIPIEGEIDIALDCVAPTLPGRYISCWIMASPAGLTFGQRIWVIIQVDASLEPLSGSFSQMNLNLPPQSNGFNNPAVIDINIEPSAVASVEPVTDSSKVVDQVIKSVAEVVTGKGLVEDQHLNHEPKGASSETVEVATNEQDLNFPINDFLLVGDAYSNGTAPPVTLTPSVAHPIVESSKIEAGDVPLNGSSKMDSLAPPPKSEGSNKTEELLLKNLSAMGFNQIELNKEILRKNGCDMEKTLVDLRDISEWDPIMDELEEMGFSDKKKNAILLVKNKGSIKRVVMDLVADDKSQ